MPEQIHRKSRLRLRHLLPVLIHLALCSRLHGLCMEDCTLVLESPLPNSIFRVGMIPVIFHSHGAHCNETEMWVDVEVLTRAPPLTLASAAAVPLAPPDATRTRRRRRRRRRRWTRRT